MPKTDLKEIKKTFYERLESVKDRQALEKVRVAFLGRKGELTLLLRGLSSLSQEEKKQIGRETNLLKKELSEALDKLEARLFGEDTKKKLEVKTDLTLPERTQASGRPHPLIQVMEESLEFFRSFGFSELDVPELETEWYNFDALNTPADHPSRDLTDTFYLEGGLLLRCQTSTVQIHAMEKMKPPLRVMAAGKCYRSDAVDATHFPIFHQIDGLIVDENVSFSDLKGLLECYAQAMLGPEAKIRFRPHYFPFTEPSAEVDFSCALCAGKGCATCKGQGWIEVVGAGMTDPAVFEKVGYDAERYQGLAFGFGLERVAMMRHRIDDIRLFYENDLRFLEQF